MFNIKLSIFSTTRDLEQKIDQMHDKVIESSMFFKEAFDIYMREKRSSNYRRVRKKLKILKPKPMTCDVKLKAVYIFTT